MECAEVMMYCAGSGSSGSGSGDYDMFAVLERSCPAEFAECSADEKCSRWVEMMFSGPSSGY